MKLASIVPVKDIEHTFDGQYAMMLAHLKDYYPKNCNKNCYCIMDNSLIELGGAVDVEQVVEAACQCNADEIILPDVFQDGPATIEKVTEALKWLNEHKVMRFRYMAVCQGKDIDEFVECFRALENIPQIHCIGIPKVCETLTTSGRPFFEWLWVNSPKQVHLLGCWTSLRELKMYTFPQRIRSVDTCIPALLAVNGFSDVWMNRPIKTIDLKNDSIIMLNYLSMMNQLQLEGLV